MSYQIRIASDRIKQDVPQTETSIDQALISVSNLLATLVQARVDTGVPAATGQIAVRRLAKAQMALVEASSDVLRVHGELKKVGQEFAGLDVHDTCPPAQAAVGPGNLHSVAA
ncbi:hypothetical protein [Sphingorhabdus sp. M41]|uniref:hypothetical protein n=1 Tax=Sphingorhabdus sp. M41 TaxID=1806885 RepID=UPI00078CC13E|nr:hypothetical protein [Sphingorhabdus sp. M41]AMO72160.1 hypothetical protein AZE99_10130 [Sphingorhabdus sp. M41]